MKILAFYFGWMVEMVDMVEWLKILTFYIGWMVEMVEWLMVENSSFLFWLNGWNGWMVYMLVRIG